MELVSGGEDRDGRMIGIGLVETGKLVSLGYSVALTRTAPVLTRVLSRRAGRGVCRINKQSRKQ